MEEYEKLESVLSLYLNFELSISETIQILTDITLKKDLDLLNQKYLLLKDFCNHDINDYNYFVETLYRFNRLKQK